MEFLGLDTLDVEFWVRQHVDAKSIGDELQIANCPECGNAKGKLYLNVTKKVWICHVCEWGKGTRDFTQFMAKISRRSVADVRKELVLYNAPATPAQDTTSFLDVLLKEPQEQNDDVSSVQVPDDGFQQLPQVLVYVKDRGLTAQDVVAFNLRATRRVETSRGSKIFGPFLVFPVRWGAQQVAWQGRRVTDRVPKYVSSPRIKSWLWPFCDAFFDVYTGDSLTLVEGVFDAIGCLRMGIPAMCTFGKSLSQQQQHLLRALKPKKLYFAWDMDAKNQVVSAVKGMSALFDDVFVVPCDKKLDFGDTLNSVDVRNELQDRFNCAVHVRSTDFLRWQLGA